MFELSLGFILAIWFVAAYFIYRKVFGPSHEIPPESRTLNAPRERQLEENKPKLFLPTEEMSRHHAGPRGDDPADKS